MNTATIRQSVASATVSLCLMAALTATAQTVTEVGDTGEFPVTAQQESGQAITLITGAISSATDIDMYRITIDDPSSFSATTVGPAGVGTIEDTRLFLLDESGYPVYFNDDVPSGGTYRSLLPAGDALSPSIPGDYYLAVAGYPKYPGDGVTNIFSEPDFDPGFTYTDVIGPNPSSTSPISDWFAGNADMGTYEITLTGVNGTLPVELSGLQVVVDNGDANVRWSTLNELHNAGFDIEVRSISDATFRTVGYVQARGEPSDYYFRVDGLEPGRYTFRIRQVDSNGSATYSSSIEAVVELTGTHFVSTAYPNPFVDNTTINISVRDEQRVIVQVFDLTGRRVALLSDGVLPTTSTHRLTFAGSGLPSGLYVIRVTGERFNTNRIATLIRP